MGCSSRPGTGLGLYCGSRGLRDVRGITDEQLGLFGSQQLQGRRRPEVGLSESRPLSKSEQSRILPGHPCRIAVDVESKQSRVAVAAEEVEADESAARRELGDVKATPSHPKNFRGVVHHGSRRVRRADTEESVLRREKGAEGERRNERPQPPRLIQQRR